ncbi:MAG: signal recognition particle receptor subunit alpha, partial [Planctomycetes bacterium]|nr:signal recognition particle receptor subunit alpha [Planctomycetota bacterium]
MALKWFGGKKKDSDDAESSDAAGAAGTTEPAASEESTKKRGLFGALKRGLSKTSQLVKKAIQLVSGKLDEDALEEIEASLIQADFGPRVALELTDALRHAYKDKEFKQEELVPFLKERLTTMLGERQDIRWAESGTTVILVTGVNGTGKTTSIAKLANRFQSDGAKVLVAAGDTFRAAAVEQLAIWSDRLGIAMVQGRENADPASVVFDAIDRAQSEGFD